MKKILLALIALVTINIAMAQNCVPDNTYTAPGVYPDSATGLSPAYVGVPYNQTITEVVPVDTCIVLIFPPCTTIPIDSIIIDTFTGLPAGFNVVSLNETSLPFKFLGGTTSCMLITGTATAGQVGNYPLHVSGLSWATVLGSPTSQPFTVDYYSIDVLNTTGIEAFNRKDFQVHQNRPNPFNNSTLISYYLPQASNVSFAVSNVLGKVVKSDNITAHQGENTITLNASDFSNGIYFYSLTYNNKVVTKRFIVNK